MFRGLCDLIKVNNKKLKYCKTGLSVLPKDYHGREQSILLQNTDYAVTLKDVLEGLYIDIPAHPRPAVTP